METVFPVLL